MSHWDDYDDPAVAEAYATVPAAAVMTYQQVTTKIPRPFAGNTTWFAYEEAIDDWVDVTELDAEKRGPALRNRLEGEAAVYKPLFDRDRLRNAATGVQYFKRTLRPHFVKGNQAVFLWRFFQFVRASRGTRDMLLWIAKFAVIKKRLSDSWMDLIDPLEDPNDPTFAAAFAARNRDNAANNLPALEVEDALAQWNVNRGRAHMNLFPLSDNLISLLFTCLADLNENQRERMTSALTLRGLDIQQYTFEIVRAILIELFCAPKSSLDNPSLRAQALRDAHFASWKTAKWMTSMATGSKMKSPAKLDSSLKRRTPSGSTTIRPWPGSQGPSEAGLCAEARPRGKEKAKVTRATKGFALIRKEKEKAIRTKEKKHTGLSKEKERRKESSKARLRRETPSLTARAKAKRTWQLNKLRPRLKTLSRQQPSQCTLTRPGTSGRNRPGGQTMVGQASSPKN